MTQRARGIRNISKMADEGDPNDTSTISSETTSVDIKSSAILLAGVTLASVFGGFGLSVGMARRRSPDAFSKGHNEATQLALKALGWGTVLAISGVGLLVVGVKTALGVKDAKEFGAKMKHILPSKDGKFVSHFDSWKISRKSGKWNELSDSWLSSDSGNNDKKK